MLPPKRFLKVTLHSRCKIKEILNFRKVARAHAHEHPTAVASTAPNMLGGGTNLHEFGFESHKGVFNWLHMYLSGQLRA